MSHAIRKLFLAALLSASTASALSALPVRPPSMLLQDASVAIRAKVLRIDLQADTSRPGQVVTYAVAELEVVGVMKGIDLQPGDKIAVKYWWRKWLPGTAPMPGNDGHTGIPTEGETLQVYLSGTPSGGFQVMLPNGFVR